MELSTVVLFINFVVDPRSRDWRKEGGQLSGIGKGLRRESRWGESLSSSREWQKREMEGEVFVASTEIGLASAQQQRGKKELRAAKRRTSTCRGIFARGTVSLDGTAASGKKSRRQKKLHTKVFFASKTREMVEGNRRG